MVEASKCKLCKERPGVIPIIGACEVCLSEPLIGEELSFDRYPLKDQVKFVL